MEKVVLGREFLRLKRRLGFSPDASIISGIIQIIFEVVGGLRSRESRDHGLGNEIEDLMIESSRGQWKLH